MTVPRFAFLHSLTNVTTEIEMNVVRRQRDGRSMFAIDDPFGRSRPG